jgi:acyl carrier protein
MAAVIFARISELIVPFNKKGVAITPDTNFANDLAFDSLTVMDFVAAVEDEYDIIIPLNALPDLETVQQVAEAVAQIIAEKSRG